MARRQVVVSDLTGQVIDDPDQVATIRVLEHPLIDHPVKLDAFVLEVANLKESKRELVTIEVDIPNGETERLIMELKDFDKLIVNGEPDDVLNGAERYLAKPEAEAPRRRGRPAGAKNKASTAPAAPKPKRDPDLLNQIRSWARDNGWPDLGNRGRIPAAAEEAWEAAHQSA